ncbi:MAG: gluconokinase [Thermoanaerobaculia bacterium]|nr:gluconokinase [Thermoanaerobaculia bacterium]
MIVVVMGVSGCGKSTIGERLAEALDWAFVEGDQLHPVANVEKMHAGLPLTDEDRRPWLERLRGAIEARLGAGESAVVACSALKESYRRVLLDGIEDALLVYLKGDRETLEARLHARTEHFFDPALLASQLETLEEPSEALVVEITSSPEEIVTTVLEVLDERGEPGDSS